MATVKSQNNQEAVEKALNSNRRSKDGRRLAAYYSISPRNKKNPSKTPEQTEPSISDAGQFSKDKE